MFPTTFCSRAGVQGGRIWRLLAEPMVEPLGIAEDELVGEFPVEPDQVGEEHAFLVHHKGLLEWCKLKRSALTFLFGLLG